MVYICQRSLRVKWIWVYYLFIFAESNSCYEPRLSIKDTTEPFLMYWLITSSCSRCSMASISSTLTMLDGEHIEHAHDAQWQLYRVHSRCSMANISRMTKYVYKYVQCVYLRSIMLNNSLLLDHLIIQLSYSPYAITTHYLVMNLI